MYVALLILALPWFSELFFFIVPPSRLSLARFIAPSFDECLTASVLIISFLLVTYFFARISSRILIPFENSSFFLASKGILRACTILLPLFTVLDLIFLFNSLKGGLFEALLAFRSNELPIGYFGYFIFYYYPVVLAVTWSRNKALVNTFCFVLIAFANLLTGFRTLLISSSLIIIIYNFSAFNRFSRSTKLVSILVSVILFLAYGAFRANLELGNEIDVDTGGTFLDGLNRSFPIRYMVISFREDVSATFANLLDVFISPFSVLIQKADGLYDLESTTVITERLVRPYLVWRGTPGYLATGFSIHIISFSYLFYGVFGLLFFASLIGLSLGLGINFSRFKGILPRVAGTFLITFVFSCTESFVSGFASLCYRLLFLLFLVIFSAASSRSLQR